MNDRTVATPMITRGIGASHGQNDGASMMPQKTHRMSVAASTFTHMGHESMAGTVAQGGRHGSS